VRGPSLLWLTRRLEDQLARWERRAEITYYDLLATEYRAVDDAAAGGATRSAIEEWGVALREAAGALSTDAKIIDIGCGTGRYFNWIAQGALLVGVDLSHMMLQQAHNPVRAEAIRVPFQLVEGDARRLPFGATTFDLAYSLGVLAEHVTLDAKAVGEAMRVLKSGGIFLFSARPPTRRGWLRSLRHALAVARFALLFGWMSERRRKWFYVGRHSASEAEIGRVLSASGSSIEYLRESVVDFYPHLLVLARKSNETSAPQSQRQSGEVGRVQG
jgi:ubiquinone/menaquinone biosynthesis C-methylase UbiE